MKRVNLFSAAQIMHGQGDQTTDQHAPAGGWGFAINQIPVFLWQHRADRAS